MKCLFTKHYYAIERNKLMEQAKRIYQIAFDQWVEGIMKAGGTIYSLHGVRIYCTKEVLIKAFKKQNIDLLKIEIPKRKWYQLFRNEFKVRFIEGLKLVKVN